MLSRVLDILNKNYSFDTRFALKN